MSIPAAPPAGAGLPHTAAAAAVLNTYPPRHHLSLVDAKHTVADRQPLDRFIT